MSASMASSVLLPSGSRLIGDRDAKLGGLAGEHGIDPRERDFQPHEIALALVHGHKADADQNERQYERQVVVVVHRAQQHGERP